MTAPTLQSLRDSLATAQQSLPGGEVVVTMPVANLLAVLERIEGAESRVAEMGAEVERLHALNAKLSAALAESEQQRKPHTLDEDEYRVLWRMAEANLKQGAVETEELITRRAEVEQLRQKNDQLKAMLGNDGRCPSCYHVRHTCLDPNSECVCNGPNECRARRLARYGRVNVLGE